MTPASSGMTFFRIFFSRVRSVSGSLRLMPVIDAVRHVHQVPAGQADLAGQPGALVADRVLGDLDERPTGPDFSARLDPLGLPFEPGASKFTSPAYSTALRPLPMSTNAASIDGSTFCTLPR